MSRSTRCLTVLLNTFCSYFSFSSVCLFCFFVLSNIFDLIWFDLIWTCQNSLHNGSLSIQSYEFPLSLTICELRCIRSYLVFLYGGMTRRCQVTVAAGSNWCLAWWVFLSALVPVVRFNDVNYVSLLLLLSLMQYVHLLKDESFVSTVCSSHPSCIWYAQTARRWMIAFS